MPTVSASPLNDSSVRAEIDRILSSNPVRPKGTLQEGPLDPNEFAEFSFPISSEQGDLIYLLCRAIGARRVVECATSLGVSTLYLAAAVRDNGGGIVIGSEIVGAKAERARHSVAAAGLAQAVEIRVGDALETFKDLEDPIDFLLLDGWPAVATSSLARSVIELVRPRLRSGAIVVNDNGEPDYLDYVRDSSNGFVTMSLPLKGGTEVSLVG